MIHIWKKTEIAKLQSLLGEKIYSTFHETTYSGMFLAYLKKECEIKLLTNKESSKKNASTGNF